MSHRRTRSRIRVRLKEIQKLACDFGFVGLLRTVISTIDYSADIEFLYQMREYSDDI